MTDFRAQSTAPGELHPGRSLLILLGFVLIGMSLGGILAAALLLVWTTSLGEDALLNSAELLNSPELFEGSWYLLMGVQSISHAFTFLLPSLLFWRVVERQRWDGLHDRPLSAVQALGAVALLTIAFMPFNGLIIEWNQGLRLPVTFQVVEEWMKAKEAQLSKLTRFLTTFDDPLQLVLAVFVIAVLPAVGEEVLFRGLIQRKLVQWVGNVHLGIWLAALLFSAIHLQFYGFVPRVLLGALFGYLYVWSGNIWVPILAHFVNNGFTVVMVWLHRRSVVPVNIENTDSVPLTGALFSLLLTIVLLIYFQKSNSSTRLDPHG